VNHGIDEAVRGVQRLKKAPHAFREVYYKSIAGLERRRALINGQFMHEMSGEEEDNSYFFEEEFNRWLRAGSTADTQVCYAGDLFASTPQALDPAIWWSPIVRCFEG
jgi:hypothetical protein